MFTAMIAALEKKMAGFSRRETNQYYQSIMNKAWEQVKNCPREKLPEELDETLEWLALDPDYETKLGPIANDMVFPPGSGPITGTGISRSGRKRGSRRRRRAPIPGSGFAKTVSGAAGNLVGSLQAFSGALLGDGAAFTSAITRVTNPPPVPARPAPAATAAAGAAPAPAPAPVAPAPAPEGDDENIRAEKRHRGHRWSPWPSPRSPPSPRRASSAAAVSWAST